MKHSEEFILKLKETFNFIDIQQVHDWLGSHRSNFYAWKVFLDLSEKEIANELKFGGYIL